MKNLHFWGQNRGENEGDFGGRFPIFPKEKPKIHHRKPLQISKISWGRKPFSFILNFLFGRMGHEHASFQEACINACLPKEGMLIPKKERIIIRKKERYWLAAVAGFSQRFSNLSLGKPPKITPKWPQKSTPKMQVFHFGFFLCSSK